MVCLTTAKSNQGWSSIRETTHNQPKNMKTCKIILIILYVLSCIWNFIKAFVSDGDEQLTNFLAALLDAIVYGVLYAGAGIFDI